MEQQKFFCQCHGCPACDWKQWRQVRLDEIGKRGLDLPADIPCGQPVAQKRWTNEGARYCLPGCTRHEALNTQYPRGWLHERSVARRTATSSTATTRASPATWPQAQEQEPGDDAEDEEPEEALSSPPPGLGGDDESAHIERDDANIEALLSQRLQNLEDTVTVLANRQLDMAASMQALERLLLRNCPKGKKRARQ